MLVMDEEKVLNMVLKHLKRGEVKKAERLLEIYIAGKEGDEEKVLENLWKYLGGFEDEQVV